MHPAQASCGLWLRDLEGVDLDDTTINKKKTVGPAVSNMGQGDSLLLQQADDCHQMWLQDLEDEELDDAAAITLGPSITESKPGEVGHDQCRP